MFSTLTLILSIDFFDSFSSARIVIGADEEILVGNIYNKSSEFKSCFADFSIKLIHACIKYIDSRRRLGMLYMPLFDTSCRSFCLLCVCSLLAETSTPTTVYCNPLNYSRNLIVVRPVYQDGIFQQEEQK